MRAEQLSALPQTAAQISPLRRGFREAHTQQRQSVERYQHSLHKLFNGVPHFVRTGNPWLHAEQSADAACHLSADASLDESTSVRDFGQPSCWRSCITSDAAKASWQQFAWTAAGCKINPATNPGPFQQAPKQLRLERFIRSTRPPADRRWLR